MECHLLHKTYAAELLTVEYFLSFTIDLQLYEFTPTLTKGEIVMQDKLICMDVYVFFIIGIFNFTRKQVKWCLFNTYNHRWDGTSESYSSINKFEREKKSKGKIKLKLTIYKSKYTSYELIHRTWISLSTEMESNAVNALSFGQTYG